MTVESVQGCFSPIVDVAMGAQRHLCSEEKLPSS